MLARLAPLALVAVVASWSTPAGAQCCKQGGNCSTKSLPSARMPAATRPSGGYAIPNTHAARFYMANVAQAQQVAAQQAYTARQKMIRQLKKEQGAAIAAAREAQKQDEPAKAAKPKKTRQLTNKDGLLQRAAELETHAGR